MTCTTPGGAGEALNGLVSCRELQGDRLESDGQWTIESEKDGVRRIITDGDWTENLRRWALANANCQFRLVSKKVKPPNQCGEPTDDQQGWQARRARAIVRIKLSSIGRELRP